MLFMNKNLLIEVIIYYFRIALKFRLDGSIKLNLRIRII